MASSNNHGTICWLEIPVRSAARAAAFYAAVLGWECDGIPTGPPPPPPRSPPSSPPITNAATTTTATSTAMTFRTSRRGTGAAAAVSSTTAPVRGAFLQVPEDRLVRARDDDDRGGGPGRAAVLTTFAVGSIEGALGRVEEMGGRTHLPKTAIGENMGYFAQFVDCEGNLQGIWAPN